MELHFFKEFLMISHPTTVFLLLVFLLILAMIHHLEKKGTSFGKLVTIGTVSGALLGIFIQVLAGFPDAPTKVVFIKEATKWYSLVGGGFIDLIRMLVVPLVLTSIIHVILHMTVASFGTTAGMQGCAGVFPGLVVVYIANVSGIPFDLTLFIMSIVVIALGSIGIAGVPGTATMAASVSLSGTGLGAYFSSISPVLAIDPIIDMGRTMLNVSGSMTNAIVVDKIMGTFDEEAFKKE